MNNAQRSRKSATRLKSRQKPALYGHGHYLTSKSRILLQKLPQVGLDLSHLLFQVFLRGLSNENVNLLVLHLSCEEEFSQIISRDIYSVMLYNIIKEFPKACELVHNDTFCKIQLSYVVQISTVPTLHIQVPKQFSSLI